MDDDSSNCSVVCVDSDTDDVNDPIVCDWSADFDAFAPPGTVFSDFPEEIVYPSRSNDGYVSIYQV